MPPACDDREILDGLAKPVNPGFVGPLPDSLAKILSSTWQAVCEKDIHPSSPCSMYVKTSLHIELRTTQSDKHAMKQGERYQTMVRCSMRGAQPGGVSQSLVLLMLRYCTRAVGRRWPPCNGRATQQYKGCRWGVKGRLPATGMPAKKLLCAALALPHENWALVQASQCQVKAAQLHGSWFTAVLILPGPAGGIHATTAKAWCVPSATRCTLCKPGTRRGSGLPSPSHPVHSTAAGSAAVEL